MFKKRVKKVKQPKNKSIKEKILPKKKKDRLDELRKELGMKKGGSALKPVDKQKNPGLAKLPTQVRNKMGYMRSGGPVRQFGGGKKPGRLGKAAQEKPRAEHRRNLRKKP